MVKLCIEYLRSEDYSIAIMGNSTRTFFSLNWKIAGKAGEGVMVISKMMAKICKRHGLHSFNYLEYPSLIKGGHQTGQVFASDQKISCQKRHLDMLITLDQSGFDEHKAEITPQTIIIYNSDSGELDLNRIACKSEHVLQLPFYSISKEKTGHTMAMNVVALGVSAFFLGFNHDITKQVIIDEFKDKGSEILHQDLLAYEAGFNQGKKIGKPIKKTPISSDSTILVTGNEAVGLGALAAGVQFYSAYPMTPASGLLHFFASQQHNYPLVVKHAEDEIGAINHALGASFAGVRAMTGSSGGGFALMVESVSFASIAEIPIVILEAQRKGPATGLPTWTEQADLSFVLTSGHGDMQRVVLTPGSIEEHYQLTRIAFYLAEKYQVPVFILSDKFALESHQTLALSKTKNELQRYSIAQDIPQDTQYKRYQLTSDGISPRSYPSVKNGIHLTNSYEHDEFGFATEEATMTTAQANKRRQKSTTLSQEIPQPYKIGPKNADITFVTWGSTLLVMQQLVTYQYMYNFKYSINVIHLPCIWPFPVEAFTSDINTTNKKIIIEGNQTGQAEKLIRQETGITFDSYIRKYDGRPFYIEDLVDWINNYTL